MYKYTCENTYEKCTKYLCYVRYEIQLSFWYFRAFDWQKIGNVFAAFVRCSHCQKPPGNHAIHYTRFLSFDLWDLTRYDLRWTHSMIFDIYLPFMFQTCFLRSKNPRVTVMHHNFTKTIRNQCDRFFEISWFISHTVIPYDAYRWDYKLNLGRFKSWSQFWNFSTNWMNFSLQIPKILNKSYISGKISAWELISLVASTLTILNSS